MTTEEPLKLKIRFEDQIAGIILRDGAEALALFPSLSRRHFHGHTARGVLEAARRLAADNQTISVATVGAHFRSLGFAAHHRGANGSDALDALVAGAPKGEALHLMEAELLALHSEYTKVEALAEALQRAKQGDDFGDILREVQRRVDVAELPEEAADAEHAQPIASLIDEGLISVSNRAHGRERPIVTPWRSLNEHMRGGMWPGLYTLTGNTGSGKTQWALQVALEAASAEMVKPPGERRAVVYVALELGAVDISTRCIGLMAGMPHWQIAYPRDEAFGDVMDVVAKHRPQLAALPLFVKVAPPVGWSYQGLQVLAEHHKPKLLVIDYAQLVSAPRGSRDDTRTTVGTVAKIGRDIARRHNAVVLALCSTARANYEKLAGEKLGPGNDPSDLVGLGKESGELEYTADCALVLAHVTKPDRTDPNRIRLGTTWLAIAKGRGYGSGWSEHRFDGSRFTEPDEGTSPDLGSLKHTKRKA